MIRELINISKELSQINSISLSEFNKDNTAVIVIDMVKGFYNVGPLASQRVEKIIRPIIVLNEKTFGYKKIFFIDSHTENSIEFKSYPIHCLNLSEEEELIDELKDGATIHSNTSYIKKNSINGFHSPQFNKWLKENTQIDKFIVVGVCTDICVESFTMALRTYFNEHNINKRIIVPVNMVETYDAGNHNAELMNMMALYKMKSNGIEVVKEIEF